MSFGVAFSNAIAIGLGGIVSMFSGMPDGGAQVNNLLCENGDNLVQEDGGQILLE